MRRFAWCVFTIAFASSVLAQTPLVINYQGKLINGTNLVNGSVGLSLRLFNASSGGSSLYEDSNSVTVVDGLYSTLVGDNPASAAFISALTNPAVWVEVAVNGVTLAPRERLAAVGYSLATRGIGVDTNGNVIVNPELNAIHPSAQFSTIAGGDFQSIQAPLSFIGSGEGNTMESGASYSFIGSGSANVIQTNADNSVIGGGLGNRIMPTSQDGVIGGGILNAIQRNSTASFIGGGFGNSIGTNAPYSAVPGGRDNATGNNATNSFAAGRRAKANHPGTFVWADNTDADFSSTTNNQFLIRASGGVGIGTNGTAGNALVVAGNVNIKGTTVVSVIAGNGVLLTNITGASIATNTVTSSNLALPLSLVYSNFPDAVVFVKNTGGGPALWAEATNASGLAAINWGDGNALFAANAGGGPSAIFLGGNVGVGTQTPAERFSANGLIQSLTGGFRFPDGSVQDTAAENYWQINDAGDVYVLNKKIGVGTASPSNSVHIEGGFDVPALQFHGSRIAGGVSNTFYLVTNVTASASQTNRAYDALWTGLGNLRSNDNQFATIQLTSKNGTNYVSGYTRQYYAASIFVTNLGFNIPTNAIVTKIFMFCTYRSSFTNSCRASTVGAHVFFAQNGNVLSESSSLLYLGTNYAGAKSTNLIYHPAQGAPYTPAVVNSSSFGVILAPEIEFYDYYDIDYWTGKPTGITPCDPIGTPSISIDQIRVQIEYRLSDSFTYQVEPNYVIGVPDDSTALIIAPGAVPRTNGVGGIRIETNGYVYINVLNPSDRNAKENFKPVDPADVLEKVSALPMTTWNFKGDPDALHLGPMAQDFHAAFGLGPNNISIANVDEAGVALTAIQALKKENDEMREMLEQLRARLDNLESK